MSYNTELQENNAELEAILDAVNELPESTPDEAVLYTEQPLTEEQKAQARKNIGAQAELTDADKEEIVQQVITALGTPVFGRVEEGNKITLSTEHLADGTYYLGYEDKDGNWVEICTLDHNGQDEPTYTNQIPISTDTDGSVYNTTGYKTASRISSSGGISNVNNASASNPAFVTGFIPCKKGDIIRLASCYIDTDGTGNDANYYGQDIGGLRVAVYDSSKTYLIAAAWNEYESSGLLKDYAVDTNGYITKFSINNANCAFVRLCLGGDPETAIVTINEEIE